MCVRKKKKKKKKKKKNRSQRQKHQKPKKKKIPKREKEEFHTTIARTFEVANKTQINNCNLNANNIIVDFGHTPHYLIYIQIYIKHIIPYIYK
jgi:hypothetical protein